MAGRRPPVPGAEGPPLADAEDDWPAGAPQRVAELGVLDRRVEGVRVAPILFDVVHTPGSKRTGVLHFVAVGAGAALARLPSRVSVDAELEALSVHVVGERLDAAGEAARIGNQPPPRLSSHLPAIVHDDVAVAGLAHAARDHGVGRLPDQLGGDVAPEVIPAVPPHGRRAGETVVERGAAGSSG